MDAINLFLTKADSGRLTADSRFLRDDEGRVSDEELLADEEQRWRAPGGVIGRCQE
jgi:hypothetical protein